MPTQTRPNLTIQTGSLWASGDPSRFSGTSGPAYFDPFLGEFSDVVNSTGLAVEPIQDSLAEVDAGDQVTFVIAVQNMGLGAAYDIKLRDTLPIGFTISPTDITVTDGAGGALTTTGNLFDPADGLTVATPLTAYDDTSGSNVVLITFTAAATDAIALPGAEVTNAAQVVSFAGVEGGPNLAPTNGAPLSDVTPVTTGAIAVTSMPDQPDETLVTGCTASFDVTVALPEGTVRDLRIDQVLPQIGTSFLQLDSAQILSIGGHLTTGAPPVVQPDGSIQFGTVVNQADNLVTDDDDLVIRVTVRGSGTTAGTGAVDTVVSAADPNGGTARTAQTVVNTLMVGPPDVPPTLSGVGTGQFATTSMLVMPFMDFTIAGTDPVQQQTLTIHRSDPSLGTLSGPFTLTTNSAGDTVLTGTAPVVQTMARTLLFTPNASASGSEIFTLSIVDAAGGSATAQAGLSLTPAAHPSELAHFAISPQTVLTSTATGSSTFAQVETYAGPISDIGTQFLYDGDTPWRSWRSRTACWSAARPPPPR